ncbi:MAG: AI-2E family transporter [Acidobacteriota bacterium]
MMNDPFASSRGFRALLVAAALAVLAQTLQWAQALLVPFLLSVFLAVIAASPVAWLRRHGVPNWTAVVLVVVAIMAGVVAVAVFIGRTINEFTSRIPIYTERLQEELMSMSGDLGQRLSLQELFESVEPGAVMNLVSGMLAALSGVLGNAFLIFFTVLFLLLEASGFPAKIQAAFGGSAGTQLYFNRAADDLKHYLSIKTATSLFTGAAVATWAALVGVDFALLWGLTAFLLNYVPNIGSIIAAIPAVLLAFIQLGLASAVVLALGYIVVNLTVGNLIEPRVMGKRLGLSTLVVFLSLLFWGWVLGPLGMLLSAPLTLTIKIAMEAKPSTRWFAVLLGPEIRPTDDPPAPQEERPAEIALSESPESAGEAR